MSVISYVLAVMVIPVLGALFMVLRPSPKNTPPRFSYFWQAITGSFNLDKNGPAGLVRAGYDKLGEIFTIRLFHKDVTFFVGTEAQSAFFAATDSEMSQQELYSFTVPVFGEGIAYGAEPKRMAQQLRLLKHSLDGDAMRQHSAKIVEEVELFVSGWKDEGVINLHHTLSDLTINTASRALLGSEIRNNLCKEMADLYQDLSDGMTFITIVSPRAPTALHRKRDEARAKIVSIFKKVITDRRARQSAPDFAGAKEHDMLQHFMDATYPNGDKPSDDEICGLLLAALFAGQHTSTITATWMGYKLFGTPEGRALIPDLIKEQREVLTETGGKMTIDTLSKMELLYSCVKETLRMYPPLVSLMRTVVKPFKYKNYTLPPGNIVAVCPSVAHFLPEVFDNPETFDPRRFLKEWDTATLKGSWTPFGGGRHMCLGQRFGLLQVTAIWSLLLRNYSFEMDGPVPDIDYSHLVAGPKTSTIRFKRLAEPIRFGSASPSASSPANTASAAASPVVAERETARAPGTMTAAEVAKHNTAEDCYLTIDSKVYNVTQWLDKHPGGRDRLLTYAGLDASFEFESQNHSKRARELLKPMFVANLVGKPSL